MKTHYISWNLPKPKCPYCGSEDLRTNGKIAKCFGCDQIMPPADFGDSKDWVTIKPMPNKTEIGNG